MSMTDTLQKLRIQVQACMRGIHGDYTLVERADLKQLLDDHERLTTLMWSKIDRSFEEWKKELNPAECSKMCDMTPKGDHILGSDVGYTNATDGPAIKCLRY